MIEGNDGGANVSFNGGATWSTIYNQPTAQFYRIDVDNQYPYRVYGTQQDNTSISVPSASEWGVITLGRLLLSRHRRERLHRRRSRRPQHRLCRRDRLEPGRRGALQRYDHRTRQIQLVNVWPEESTRHRAQGPEVPLCLDLPDRVLAARSAARSMSAATACSAPRDEGMSWADDLARPQPERPRAPGRVGRRRSPARAPAPRSTRPAPASSNRRIAAARSGPRPTTAWSMSRATAARAGRTSRPRPCRSSPMSAASRSRRTTPTRSTSRPRATSSPTTGRYLFKSTDGGESWKSINGDLPQGRDHAASCAPIPSPGPALCRHRDRHPSSASTTARLDAHGRRPARRAGLRHEAQGQRPGGGDARPLVLDPRRRDGAARAGRRPQGRRACSRRARRSAPSCTGAPAPTSAPASPMVRPSASTAAR